MSGKISQTGKNQQGIFDKAVDFNINITHAHTLLEMFIVL